MRPSEREREREAPIEVFSCEICKMLRPSILQNTSELLLLHFGKAI